MEDDNTFQQITIESDNRTAEDRRMRHKTKMDKHLGDYDNQKSVLRHALYNQMQEQNQ